MNCFPFRMPTEVILELMDDDGLDRNTEYFGDSDCERGQEFSYDQPARFLKCHNCGFPHLRWKETPNGYRLAYVTGRLKDKLHACEHELQQA